MNEQEIQRLLVRLTGDASSYQRMVSDVTTSTSALGSRMSLMSQRVSMFGMHLRGYGMQMAAVGAGLVGISSGISNVMKGVSLAAQAEENEIAFGVMLGSMEKGKDLVKELQEFAAKTPMDTNTLQSSAKLLLQFGIEGKNLLPIMKMLGDATGGNAQKMMAMSLAFGQMASTGRLMGGDLFQMVNAGFNPLQHMAEKAAKTLGGDVNLHMQRLKKEMEAGRISVNRVIEAFKEATSEGGRLAGLMEKQSQSLTGLFSTMQDDIDAVLRNIGRDIVEGLNLKGLVKDISAVAQATGAWLTGLSAGTKNAIFSFVFLLAAVSALAVGFFILKGVITAAFSGLNLVAAAVITGLVGAAAAGTALVGSLGGMVGAWALIKQKALEAWEWLRPVRAAVYDLFQTARKVAAEAWEAIQRFAVQTWYRIFGEAQINWDKIRDVIEEAIMFAEFTLLNYEQVARTVWAGVKYYALQYWEEFLHFTTVVIPAAARWLADNFVNINLDMFDRVKPNIAAGAQFIVDAHLNAFDRVVGAFHNMIKTFVNGVKGLPGLISGSLDFEKDVRVGLTEGIPGAIKDGVDAANKEGRRVKPFEMPKREVTELEKQWKKEFDALRGATGQSFEEFKKQKREAFMGPMLPEDATQKAIDGIDLAKQSMMGLKNEIKGVDAALSFSSEAVARLTEFQEMLVRKPGDPNSPSGNAVKSFDAVARNSADAKGRETNQLNVLKEIRDAIKGQKPGASLEPANIAGSV